MPTAMDLHKHVGKTAWLHVDGLRIAVHIVDAKSAYGSVKLLITPVSGHGSKWVQKSSLIMEAEA